MENNGRLSTSGTFRTILPRPGSARFIGKRGHDSLPPTSGSWGQRTFEAALQAAWGEALRHEARGDPAAIGRDPAVAGGFAAANAMRRAQGMTG
jgi:hypothetical protein